MEPTTATNLADVRDLLRRGERFLLALHASPDGDSVGSSLALAQALHGLGKTVHVSGPDPIPAQLAFIPGSEHWLPPQELQPPYDAYVFIDCADLDRVEGLTKLLPADGIVINIDHHDTNAGYGTHNVIEPAAAAAVIVERVIGALGVTLTPAMATGLYTALMTDTGSFRYENTSAQTLRLAARLVEAGANAAEIAHRVYASRRLPELRLLAAALGSLTLECEGRVALMRLSHEDFRRAGADRADTEGIVNYARSLQGVDVGLLCVEEAEEVRISLRSGSTFDVAALAAALGGGGHPRAAGCALELPLEEAEARVLAAIEARLSDAGAQAAGGPESAAEGEERG